METKERLRKLKASLLKRFPKKRVNEIIQIIQRTTNQRVGKSASIQVVTKKEIEDILRQLYDEGLFGIASNDMVKIDDYITQKRLKKQAMLRFLKHYVEPEEYHGIELSIQLDDLLNDKIAMPGQRSEMIEGLYNKLSKLNYGRRIFNQVSTGWLFKITYPKMRALENKLSDGGRVLGNEAETIKQIFYSSLKVDKTKLWVRSDNTISEIFNEINILLRPLSHDPEKVPYLDLHAAGNARKIARDTVKEFINLYPDYQMEESNVQDNPNIIMIKLTQKWDK